MGKDLNGKELGEGFSQRKDGRYTAKFRAKNGKRIEGYFNDLEEAKVWMINAKYKEEHNPVTKQVKVIHQEKEEPRVLTKEEQIRWNIGQISRSL